jgi:N-acetylmuramoyl-L-alanine amidase
MPSFADRRHLTAPAVLAAVLTLAVAALAAQDSPVAGLFQDAQSLEQTLRKEIGAYKAGTPSLPLVRRGRILMGTYEDIARLFPDSGYGDKALWQGASLAADIFDVFKDPADRASAIRLTEALEGRYPASPLVSQAQRRVSTLALPAPDAAGTATPSSRLEEPSPAGPAPPPPVRTAPTRPAQATPPAASAQAPPVLQAIRREVLPDVLRVTLELDRETPFNDERLSGPARVFVDLQNARAASGVTETQTFDADVVRQIRVGRQADRRVRVVLDLNTSRPHSVYALYNPFRVVIDFERPGTDAARAPAETNPAPVAATPAAAVARRPVATEADTPSPAVAAVTETDGPTIGAAPASAPSTTISAARREPVFTAPPPARTPGGLSMSRQLGLGIGKIVIDPGHGGQDPGAKQGTLVEAELVLDVALRLEQLLQKEGFDVVLTRRSNVYVPLEERPAIALREAADLYLSIHANASADKRVRGVETYVLNFAGNAQSASLAARENKGAGGTMSNLPDIVRTIAFNNKIEESRDFARQVQGSLVEKLSKSNPALRNLGVKQAPFVVLVGASMPSVLAEIGFITNRQDAALVKTAVYRQQIAEALAAGVARYQQRLKPSQVAASEP